MLNFASSRSASKTIHTSDFLVIGAGIIGICIARQLKKQFPDCQVTIIEKESQVGEHASGRNSGVLHAGFYYSKDSLKAKFTKIGNQALTQYCLAKSLPINRCGKLVVTKSEEELNGLHELYNRGLINGIELQLISAKEAKEIEPRVKTVQEALYSPTTSAVNPKIVLHSLSQDALAEGIIFHFDTQYLGRSHSFIHTSRRKYQAKYVINAAGLYADQVARDFSFAENYRILPFKGIYLYGNMPENKSSGNGSNNFRTHIYPVPNLNNPFLGVHVTLTVDNQVKIGPTAIPALWREQYNGFSKFKIKELGEILFREGKLLIKSPFNFKKLALEEIRKYRAEFLLKQAKDLASNLEKKNFNKWGRPGIRAQLLDIRTHTLEMDFILQGDQHSFHILNAVSPAFTCSIPFAEHVVEKICHLIK